MISHKLVVAKLPLSLVAHPASFDAVRTYGPNPSIGICRPWLVGVGPCYAVVACWHSESEE
jgi:hypothetical protein